MKFNSIKSKVAITSVSALTFVYSSASFAATTPTSTSAKTAFDDIITQNTEFLGYAWPVVAALTAGAIGIKLFKKYTGKAV